MGKNRKKPVRRKFQVKRFAHAVVSSGAAKNHPLMQEAYQRAQSLGPIPKTLGLTTDRWQQVPKAAVMLRLEQLKKLINGEDPKRHAVMCFKARERITMFWNSEGTKFFFIKANLVAGSFQRSVIYPRRARATQAFNLDKIRWDASELVIPEVCMVEPKAPVQKITEGGSLPPSGPR